MSSVFPKMITDLPEADIPFKGAKDYLSQGKIIKLFLLNLKRM